jgi:hypothetical protein
MSKLRQFFSENNGHVLLSVLLFVACLFFPGFYDRYDINHTNFIPGYSLFFLGWCSVFYGYVPWLANPLFFIALALTNDRSRASFYLGCIALTMGLCFLLYKDMSMFFITRSHSNIRTYGSGYGLWITAMATFCVGQFFYMRGTKKSTINLLSAICCVICILGYFSYSTKYGRIFLHTEQKRIFESKCLLAGDHIYTKINSGGIESILIDLIDSGFFDSRFISNPSLETELPLTLLRRHKELRFIEKRNGVVKPGRYTKLVKIKKEGNFMGQKVGTFLDAIEITQPNSKYAIIFHSHNKNIIHLNIEGNTVTIKNLESNTIMATSTFFVRDRNSKNVQFCGNYRDFSALPFIESVLFSKD